MRLTTFLPLLLALTCTHTHTHAKINTPPNPQSPLAASSQPPNPTSNPNIDSEDWAMRHLASEHHIQNFDPGAFFTLHDFDSSGGWTPDEVRRFYGLYDESNQQVGGEKREEVTREVFRVFDADRNGVVEREEWMEAVGRGERLVDFGLGPGHHGDDEYEYEIHHFEKYHDENTREEDLTHPEDIAHFAKHDREEEEAERQEALDALPIVNENIPQKFRRHPS